MEVKISEGIREFVENLDKKGEDWIGDLYVVCDDGAYTVAYPGGKIETFEKDDFLALCQIGALPIRICSACGKAMDCGWHDNELGMYFCCEEEFRNHMDSTFGNGNWRNNRSEDAFFPFEVLDQETGEWEPYDIYYTEWQGGIYE